MRINLLITFFIFSFFGYGQNWNVFNKGYRYNYKYDNSPLITNVLFVQTSTVAATDTIYSMNTIGDVNGNVLTSGLPQFLLKNIKKKADGTVQLIDTDILLIIPTCSLSQSWVFSNSTSATASCVSTSTQNIFNVVDSVKVILVNNVDSIILSKKFGIIQFPKLYAQNKYYRLAGIEDISTYSVNAMYGEKLPNAWDFYNFNVGRQWCEQKTIWQDLGNGFYEYCYKRTYTINTKTVTNSGYDYNVDIYQIQSNASYAWCSYSMAPYSFTNMNISFSGLSSYTLAENYMYPGQVVTVPQVGGNNIVKVGLQNTSNAFTKFFGNVSNSGFSSVTPQLNPAPSYDQVNANTFTASAYEDISRMYATGLGKMLETTSVFEYDGHFWTDCAINDGLDKNKAPVLTIFAYPNPANSFINLPSENGRLKLYDRFGKLVKEQDLYGKNTMDISIFPNGIYFLEVQNDSFKSIQKLIIQH